MGQYPNKVNVTHDGASYEIDISAETAIDPQNLEEAFTTHPGAYAWFATVHAAALYVMDKAKLQLDVVKSEVSAEFRGQLNDKGKPYSETAITSMLDSEHRVVEASRALIEAKRQESILRAVREAFAHRRDCLIQLGANERMERSAP